MALASLLVLASIGNVPVSYAPLSDVNLSKGNTLNIETSIYPVTYRVYSYGNVEPIIRNCSEAMIIINHHTGTVPHGTSIVFTISNHY